MALVKYKPIIDCNGYRAGDDGSVWSKRVTGAWHRLKGDPRKEDGRLRFTILTNRGRYRRAYGATLILETFVGKCPDGLECCHGNGTCTDDSLDNLRWGTSVENKSDMVSHGTRQCGEQINTAKITADDVREIRRIGYPLRQHSEKYGITTAMVGFILRRKSWKHVE